MGQSARGGFRVEEAGKLQREGRAGGVGLVGVLVREEKATEFPVSIDCRAVEPRVYGEPTSSQ